MAYIDVDLGEFGDDELLDELESRGLAKSESTPELVDKIYQLRRLGKNFDKELDQLLYDMTGRVI